MITTRNNILEDSNLKKVKIKNMQNITVPVVLYGCETWSLTLREEHRFRVSESGGYEEYHLLGCDAV
jgi:hypothetical protein